MLTASQVNITLNTPMGANLIADGATFRTWAPKATEVYIAIGYPTGTPAAAFPRNAARFVSEQQRILDWLCARRNGRHAV